MQAGNDHWKRTWAVFVACLLGITALAKVAGLFLGSSQFLTRVDPITGLANRNVVIFGAAVELGIVVLILCAALRWGWVRLLPLLFGTGALAYRLVAVFEGVTQCPCLGGLFSSNRTLTEYEGSILAAIALFLVFSYPLCHLISTTRSHD